MVDRTVDERRYDFPNSKTFAPGENRRVTWTLTERTSEDAEGNGVYEDVTDLGPYTGYELYVYDDLRKGGGLQADRRAAAIFYLTDGAEISEGVAPFVVSVFPEEKTALIATNGLMAYEFWAKKNGDWTLLRYGTIPFGP